MTEQLDTFLTVSQVAQSLQVSTMTVYRLIKRGELEAVRVGGNYRIKPDSFYKYINDSTVATETE